MAKSSWYKLGVTKTNINLKAWKKRLNVTKINMKR